MQNLIWTYFPYLILLTSVILTFSLVYKKIRRKFPVKVNCWFCNTNTRVHYDNINSFNCPNCSQYNGFTSDGHYNSEKLLMQQRVSSLNVDKGKSFCKRSEQQFRKIANNGLCVICNRNQELKIHQLAAFVPKNEDNFEEEVEEYKKKLEDSYQLCSQCNRHLKRVLNRVKTNVLGSKLAQIGIKGIKSIDSHIKQKLTNAESQFNIIKSLFVISIILISTICFFNDSKRLPQIDWKYLANAEIYRIFVIIYSNIVAFRDTALDLLMSKEIYAKLENLNCIVMVREYWTNFENQQEIMELLPLAAILLNVFLMFLNTNHIKHYIVTSFLLWSIRMCLDDFDIVKPYLESLKIVIGSSLLAVSLRMFNCLHDKEEVKELKNSSFHKLYSEYNEESESEIDYSDFDTSIASQRTVRNKTIVGKQLTPINSTLPLKQSFLVPNTSSSRTLVAEYLDRLDDYPASEMNQSFLNRSKLNDSMSRYSETFESMSARHDIRNSSQLDLQDVLSNKSFSVRPMVKDENVQVHNDITKLQIGGGNLSNMSLKDFAERSQNPFSLERSCATPTPSVISFACSSSSMRQNVVSPPKLNAVIDSADPSAAGSWVGGGYWGSPQKRQMDSIQISPPLSRTSSQSSGFESFKAEKNSRENSLSSDTERLSTYTTAEPSKVKTNLFLGSNNFGHSSSFIRKQHVPGSLLKSSFLNSHYGHNTNSSANSSIFSTQNSKVNQTLPNQGHHREFGTYRESSFFK